MITAISPILPFIGVPGGALFLAASATLLLFLKQEKGIRAHWVVVFACLSFIAFIPAIYHTSIERMFVPAYFLISLLVTSLLKYEHFLKIVDYYTRLIVLLLIGSLCALIFKLGGGNELFSIENPDGRLNYFMPFTLSNSVWYNFVRPAGIYDEPGAFSFFICVLVTLRTFLGFNKNVSFYLLVMGLITFSLAHIIFLIIFVSSEREKFVRWSALIMLICLVLFLVIYVSGAFEIFYNVFLIRFEVNELGRLHGDNRTQLLLNTLEILKTNLSYILFGLPDLFLGSQEAFQNAHGDGLETGANPLSLLLNLGLTSIFYYIALFTITIISLSGGRPTLYLLGFGLLLLQRDYIYVISYCFATSLVISLIIRFRPDEG